MASKPRPEAWACSRVVAEAYAARMSKTGKFLGIPYDWRRPTAARVKQRWWNPKDPRLFTPKAFGWGFGINFARLFRRR